MTKSTEGLGFNVTRPLSARELNHLANIVRRYGLTPDFVLPPYPSDEEVLEEHLLSHPLPKSRQDFMGKEHFWNHGDNIGLSRKYSTRLFNLVVFPERKPNQGERSGQGIPISPSTLGLVLKTRDEVGMSIVPEGILVDLDKEPRDPHSYPYPAARLRHRREFGVGTDTETVVVQADGVIDLAKDTETTQNLYGAGIKIVRLFETFGQQLEATMVG